MQPPPLGPQPSTALPQPQPGGPPPPPTGYASPPVNTLAVVSLAAGIASYVVLPFIGALIAVIAGHAARGQIRRTGEGGAPLALIGLVLGYIHLALVIVLIVVAIVFFGGIIAILAGQHH